MERVFVVPHVQETVRSRCTRRDVGKQLEDPFVTVVRTAIHPKMILAVHDADLVRAGFRAESLGDHAANLFGESLEQHVPQFLRSWREPQRCPTVVLEHRP
jgi:hypothetical protein